MTTKDFIQACAENVISDLEECYGVKRGNEEKYVNSPFPDKEDFLNRFESEIQDPWEAIEDIDILSISEIEQMENEGKIKIQKAYDLVKGRRDIFLRDKGIFNMVD